MNRQNTAVGQNCGLAVCILLLLYSDRFFSRQHSQVRFDVCRVEVLPTKRITVSVRLGHGGRLDCHFCAAFQALSLRRRTAGKGYRFRYMMVVSFPKTVCGLCITEYESRLSKLRCKKSDLVEAVGALLPITRLWSPGWHLT